MTTSGAAYSENALMSWQTSWPTSWTSHSLSQAAVRGCSKTSTIIPAPKKTVLSCLNSCTCFHCDEVFWMVGQNTTLNSQHQHLREGGHHQVPRSTDLWWPHLVRKQQRLYFPRKLKQATLPTSYVCIEFCVQFNLNVCLSQRNAVSFCLCYSCNALQNDNKVWFYLILTWFELANNEQKKYNISVDLANTITASLLNCQWNDGSQLTFTISHLPASN